MLSFVKEMGLGGGGQNEPCFRALFKRETKSNFLTGETRRSVPGVRGG